MPVMFIVKAHGHSVETVRMKHEKKNEDIENGNRKSK